MSDWKIVEHVGYIFRWRWTGEEKAIISWEVHEIAGNVDGKRVYADDRHSNGMQAFENPQSEPIEGGHVLYGTVKFDGCCNIQQSNADCMMHFCDTSQFVEIAKDIDALGLVFLEETGRGWEAAK